MSNKRTNSQNAEQPLKGVVLVRFSDKCALKMIIDSLETAGIEPDCEGGLGWVQICVNPDQYERAIAMLKQVPDLEEKVVQWY